MRGSDIRPKPLHLDAFDTNTLTLESAMRYFTCSAQNGRLYLHYIASALSYHTPEDVERTFNPHRDRRIHSVDELDQILRESSTRALPFGMLYLAEGLEEEARRRKPMPDVAGP